MKILEYTKEHEAFREKLHKFCEIEISPFADEWEKQGKVPKEAWRKFGEAGFLCPCLPKEYNGLGGDFLYSVIVSEQMVRTNQCGLMASLHSDIVVPYIASYARPEIKKEILPKCASGEIITAVAMTEPNAGSDLVGMTTTAIEDGNEVIINGAKTFISNGINCDVVVVAAKDPNVTNPHNSISLYLVKDGTPGFKKGKKLEKMGMNSQDTAELFFTNCRIPISQRLGEKGLGFLMLMEKLQQERIVTAMWAVTAAEMILELTINHCKNKIVNGRPLSKSQAVQFSIVEMTTEVKLGRVFIDKLIREHIEGNQVIIETSMAKYWTTDMVKRIADRCLDFFGQSASVESCPIVRAWRDIRVMSIFAGTNEIMKSIAAKFMGL